MSNMDKITGRSPEAKSLDITAQNIEQLKQLFPDVFSEGKIDFEALKAVLGENIDDSDERYNFTWNGKNKARQIAQIPSAGTLRPCKEESVNWDTTENLFIEGDNLEVLKLLQKSYHKKIKMIYIDPPYNTGKDFVYKDNFYDNIKNYLSLTNQTGEDGKKTSTNTDSSGRYHSDWLNMMYPRLKLARNLLCNDGVIFISIDDSELHNLIQICNEIFGYNCHVGTIVRKASSGSKNDSDKNIVVRTIDYILVYAMQEFSFIPELKNSDDNKYNLEDSKGKFKTRALEMQGGDDILKLRPKMGYSVYYNGKDIQLKFDYDLELKDIYFEPDNKLITSGYQCYRPRKRGNEYGRWRWGAEKFSYEFEQNNVYFNDGRIFIKERQNTFIEKYPDSLLLDFLNTQGTNELKSIFNNNKVFSFPKPVGLIKKLINLTLNKGDIILDFFAGSGTTGHAVNDINMIEKKEIKFILVQLPELINENKTDNQFKYISDITKERLRRIDSNSFGFKCFKLDKTNILPWDSNFDNLEQVLQQAAKSIKEGRSSEDVLYEIILKYGYDLTTPVETKTINGKTVFVVGAGALIVCLDDEISTETVEGIANLKAELDPETTQIVFKDEGFTDDRVKTNAIQILKQAGIEDVKSI